MSYEFSYEDEFADSTDEDVKNNWQAQDSIIFLLDGTRQMYESKSMEKCLKVCKEIARNRCSYNKKDKLGLILFGTKDTNCQVDNVTLLQKFESVDVDSLKNIQGLLDGGINKYKELALNSNEKYSIYDAIEHAFQVAHSSKTNAYSQKIIILCTCKDKPPSDEQRRIEHLVATFKDTNTKLRVIGMADNFDDSIFYKDLQIISGTCTNENYRPMSLKDLEENILYLARSVCKLPWKISYDIVVEVSLLNLVSVPKYPSKVKLNKATNEILDSRVLLKEEAAELDDSEEPPLGAGKNVSSDKLVFYKNYGGEDIHFKPDERAKIKNAALEPGIQVLAFKPIACDPMYHCKNTYFVTYSKESNENSRNFFRALVSRCMAKKVMPICKVVTKNTTVICNMIPSDDDGGFYMYKIPYNNTVRDFDALLQAYKYNDDENKCPINKDAFYLFRKLTKDMKIDFNLTKFQNPKLQKMIAHLEALAMDKQLGTLPPDTTRPPALSEKLARMKTALMTMLELQDVDTARKRPLAQKASANKRVKADVDVATLARENKLNSATVADLKAYLESVGIAPKGTKAVLMQSVKEHLGV